MIRHHPSDDLLFDYATGALAEPSALAIAVHIALCRECREKVAGYETIGGAAIESLTPAAMSAGSFDHVLAMLDRPEPEGPARPRWKEQTKKVLPSPLRDYVSGDLDSLPWKKRGKAVDSAPITFSRPGFIGRLLRIKPGAAVPAHTHKGSELTLVLSGGYTDNGDHFARGDLQIADASLTHQPKADDGEPCLCLVVLDAPIHLTGKIGRFANPFVRI